MLDVIEIKEIGDDSLISVRVQPKASANRIVGAHAGSLRIAVTAAPQKGKANAAVIALLSKVLDLPKSSVEIVRGHTGRDKTVRIQGLPESQLRHLLQGALDTGGKRGP